MSIEKLKREIYKEKEAYESKDFETLKNIGKDWQYSDLKLKELEEKFFKNVKDLEIKFAKKCEDLEITKKLEEKNGEEKENERNQIFDERLRNKEISVKDKYVELEKKERFKRKTKWDTKKYESLIKEQKEKMDKSIENLLENIKEIKNIDIRRIIDDFENLI